MFLALIPNGFKIIIIIHKLYYLKMYADLGIENLNLEMEMYLLLKLLKPPHDFFMEVKNQRSAFL